jgi:hypothetical protein
VEDWAEIRRLYLAERMSIKAIARKLCLARNTVRNAVRSKQPPPHQTGTDELLPSHRRSPPSNRTAGHHLSSRRSGRIPARTGHGQQRPYRVGGQFSGAVDTM